MAPLPPVFVSFSNKRSCQCVRNLQKTKGAREQAAGSESELRYTTKSSTQLTIFKIVSE
jgi:hypothetical protein